MIDPAVTHRASATATNGSGGATSLTLTRPTATSVRDLLVAQVAARGGSAMTIDTPDGWTRALDTAFDTTLRQATFYRVVAAGDPTTVTFAFGGTVPTQQAVGGITAYYGLKGSTLVDRHADTASTGSSATALAASITTTLPGSLVVTAFAAATGTGFGTPSGTTERYDAQSSGAASTRASVASDSFVQAAAGPTGAKSSTLTSSRWLAHLLSFAVDDVAPTVTIADPGANLRATITLEATAADVDSGVARVQFQRAVAGSGAWVNVGSAVTAAPYRVSFNTNNVSDGLYDFRAVATDNAANAASASLSSERIDNGVPTVATAFPAASGSYNEAGWSSGCAPSGLCGSAADAGSGVQTVQVSLRRSTGGLYWDGTAFAAAAETFRTASLVDGNWTFAFPGGSFPANGSYVLRPRVTDAAGNITTGATRTFTYDTAAPNTSISASQPATTNNPAPTFAFSSSESGSSFACRLDGGAFQPCLSPTTYAPLADGVHTFEVRATDRAGNTDATPAVATWRIDTSAPTASITTPVNGATVALTVAAAASAADDIGVAGVQFQLDGVALGAEDKSAPYTVSWNTRLVAGGPHTIAAVARDAAGNRTTASANVIVDNNGVAGPNLVAAYAFDENQGTAAADAIWEGEGRDAGRRSVGRGTLRVRRLPRRHRRPRRSARPREPSIAPPSPTRHGCSSEARARTSR